MVTVTWSLSVTNDTVGIEHAYIDDTITQFSGWEVVASVSIYHVQFAPWLEAYPNSYYFMMMLSQSGACMNLGVLLAR